MDTRFMFLRDSKDQPVGCLAIKLNSTTSSLNYQLSVLNPSDKFNRKLAREIALGRLVNAPVELKCADNSMHFITLQIMNDLSKNAKAPARAVRAAKLWISKLSSGQKF